MLGPHLAKLYGVETKVLIQAVKRNIERFPEDFMFQLTKQEFIRRATPYAFIEQDIAMLSRVLRSKRAIDVNIQIMRTFVQLQQMLSSHADLARKLVALEKNMMHSFA
jgi:hypothetical protein